MPNTLAHVMLFGWPLLAAVLFARLGLQRGLIWTILAGYLFLPHGLGFSLPMLPTYDKGLAAAMAALVLCIVFDRPDRRAGRAATPEARRWLPAHPLALVLVAVYVLSPFATVATNGDAQTIGDSVLPGLTAYDAASFVRTQALTLLPFLLARRYLASDNAQETLLRALVTAGLVYSLLVVVELRLSPQINVWTYGYQQFTFSQQVRDGGFRAVVFLRHGLWTMLFIAMALIAAAALWRAVSGPARGPILLAVLWLALVLALGRSLGALMLAVVILPVALLAGLRLQLLAAAAIAAMILVFPMLRSADVLPTGPITTAVATIDEGRSRSLGFRFENEDLLLARANERPLFGWGGWGRSRVLDEFTGSDISTTDGRWVIVFGSYGWVGYLAEFGLLALPILLLALRQRQLRVDQTAVGIVLVLAANLADMIPNATLTPLSWMLAGAVLARAERKPLTVAQDERRAGRSGLQRHRMHPEAVGLPQARAGRIGHERG